MKCHFCYHFIPKIFAIDHPEAAEDAFEENEENPQKYDFIFYCFILLFLPIAFKEPLSPTVLCGQTEISDSLTIIYGQVETEVEIMAYFDAL